MSRWRRRATQAFPERYEWIQRAASPRDVFWLLEADVRAALGNGTHSIPDVVERAFDLAVWAFASNQHAELRAAVSEAFFLHLPAYAYTRRALVQYVPRAMLEELLPLMRARIPEDDYLSLQQEMSLRDALSSSIDARAT